MDRPLYTYEKALQAAAEDIDFAAIRSDVQWATNEIYNRCKDQFQRGQTLDVLLCGGNFRVLLSPEGVVLHAHGEILLRKYSTPEARALYASLENQIIECRETGYIPF